MKTKLWFGVAFILGAGSLGAFQDETKSSAKFGVKIRDEKAVVVNIEGGGAIDPTQRIGFMAQGNFFVNVNTLQGQPLHLSHFPNFLIDGRFMAPGNGGRFENVNAPLPKTASGKARLGSMSTWVVDNNFRITQSVELIPSKSKKPGDKRLMDTVLVSYHLDNKGPQTHTVGVRVYMDTYVIDNDGCMFAAPTFPKRIIDGMVLQEKTLPPYLQMLQRPDLNNPGYVAHLTLDLGGRYEKVQKLVLTRHGAGFGNWDMPAFASMGDSAIGVYWAAKELKAGAKRDLAYAYGEGVAVPLESEGRFQISLGGSFEPGKIFTISAAVADPDVGQALALELPTGMQRVEGAEIQPVAPLLAGQEFSTVLWKARVLRPGDHPIRIRSSTGVTQTKIISVTENGK